jgi:hypothetical protein
VMSALPPSYNASAKPYMGTGHFSLGVLLLWQQSVLAQKVWFLTDATGTTNRKQSLLRGSLAPGSRKGAFLFWELTLQRLVESMTEALLLDVRCAMLEIGPLPADFVVFDTEEHEPFMRFDS